MAYQKYKKKEPAAKIPFEMKWKPSSYQQDIFDAWIGKEKLRNIHVEAVAGSGKSTTIVACAHLDEDKSSAAYLSFNSDIVEDMLPRMPDHLTVRTAHGFGLNAIMQHFDCKNRVNEGKYKVMSFLRDLKYDNKNDPESFNKMKEIVELVDKMRLHMCYPEQRDMIDSIVDLYQIEIEDLDRVKKDLPDIFDRIIENAKVGLVDFVDMLWIPVHFEMKVRQYGRLFVDECQDFSSLMQSFANLLRGGKVMTVGDRNQSIYGFAGADTNAVTRLVRKFDSLELPLDVCYRCHVKAIGEAQKLVPHILPREGAPEGELQVYYDPDKFEWSIIPKNNTMVLCRRNAPLIRPVFKLLREGVKATIKGRDIGAGLIKLYNSLHPETLTIPQILDKLEEHKREKIDVIMNRKNPNPNAIEAIEDNCMALSGFIEQCTSPYEVPFKIKQIFEQEGGVVFSSIHKSKGLEADNVYILDHSNVRLKRPDMSPEQQIQEKNLEYVAKTRPKQVLGYIG